MEGQFTIFFLHASTITERGGGPTTITKDKGQFFFLWKDNLQIFTFMLAQSQREEGAPTTITKQKEQLFSKERQITILQHKPICRLKKERLNSLNMNHVYE
jgi:hypothetical protein